MPIFFRSNTLNRHYRLKKKKKNPQGQMWNSKVKTLIIYHSCLWPPTKTPTRMLIFSERMVLLWSRGTADQCHNKMNFFVRSIIDTKAKGENPPPLNRWAVNYVILFIRFAVWKLTKSKCNNFVISLYNQTDSLGLFCVRAILVIGPDIGTLFCNFYIDQWATTI